MAECPKCKKNISDEAIYCEHCGERVIPGDELSIPPDRITTWQKVVIVVSILGLIAIGLTFRDAEKRENAAAQKTFSTPLESYVYHEAQLSGLASAYGEPLITLTAQTDRAMVYIDFPKGPMTMRQASDFALDVCGKLARIYVQKGYMSRALAVNISSGNKDGAQIYYGEAVYNGETDILGWEPAGIDK